MANYLIVTLAPKPKNKPCCPKQSKSQRLKITQKLLGAGYHLTVGSRWRASLLCLALVAFLAEAYWGFWMGKHSSKMQHPQNTSLLYQLYIRVSRVLMYVVASWFHLFFFIFHILTVINN